MIPLKKKINLIFVRFHSFMKIQNNTWYTSRSETIDYFWQKNLTFYHLASDTQMIHNLVIISTNNVHFEIFQTR